MATVAQADVVLDAASQLEVAARPVRPSAPSRRGDFRAILGDGAAYSLMVGLGETYLPAFALALGIGGIGAGLLATVPMLAGAVLQLASPWAVGRLGSYRTWVVGCAVCQAVSLLLLPLAALVSKTAAAVLVFVFASTFWAAGLAAGPAWNTWVENLVPRPLRARFFALRVRVGQLCILAGFAVAGLVLSGGAASGRTIGAFVLLFVAAAGCRLISARCLASQSEILSGPFECRSVALAEWPARFRNNAGGNLLLYLFAVQIAVQISGPYFTPYMLSQLKLSYLEYVELIGVAFLGKVAALPTLARFAQRYGARRLLWVGGIGIVPVSGLWFFSQSFAYLAGVQLLSGVVWAGYELAMLLMFFEAIPKDERTSVLTVYNLGNAASMAIGALIGGALLSLIGQGATGFLTLFVVSSLARASTVLLLVRLREVGTSQAQPAVLRLHSAAVSIERPAYAGNEESPESQVPPGNAPPNFFDPLEASLPAAPLRILPDRRHAAMAPLAVSPILPPVDASSSAS